MGIKKREKHSGRAISLTQPIHPNFYQKVSINIKERKIKRRKYGKIFHQVFNFLLIYRSKNRILIIVNLIGSLAVNIKNFFILYNERRDCRYIGHVSALNGIGIGIEFELFIGSNLQGSSTSPDVNDTIEALLVFVTRVLTYFLPIIASLFVFRLRAEEKKVFQKEEYYEEGVYTVALGMKP